MKRQYDIKMHANKQLNGEYVCWYKVLPTSATVWLALCILP